MKKCENAIVGGHCNNDLEEVKLELLAELENENGNSLKSDEIINDVEEQLKKVGEGFCCELCENEYYEILKNS